MFPHESNDADNKIFDKSHIDLLRIIAEENVCQKIKDIFTNHIIKKR